MRPEDITAVILTCDESPNIGRTLDRLRWASDIVIVDSGSRDGTTDIAAAHPNVRLHARPFDTHAAQWTHAITKTGIATDWVLALDADYLVSEELIEELRELRPADDVDGYEARFVYCMDGKPLRGALYPPVTVLFRRRRATYRQDGHTHRVVLPGRIGRLRGVIFHDDRKPKARWLAAQKRYVRLEADKLERDTWSMSSWPDRIRMLRVIAPGAVAIYCLFVKGLLLDGRAGLRYTFERVQSELLLSMCLLERDFARLRAVRRRG